MFTNGFSVTKWFQSHLAYRLNYFGIRLVHELGGTHAMIGLASLWLTRFQQWGQWYNLAQDPALDAVGWWFCKVLLHSLTFWSHIACAPRRAAFGHAGAKSKSKSMITSAVCFAAGHRKIYTTDLRKLDVHCRKLFRRVVGSPADIDWNHPWHTILHAWHRRINQQLEYHGFKMWSTKYLSEY